MSSVLIAVGGNSLIRAGEKGTIDEQLANTRRTADAIVALLREGHHLVVTHGNGPQVGAALLRSERASDQVYGQSLDVCDAATQGEIGYLLQQSLRNALDAAGMTTPVVTVLTQVVVCGDDPAMRHPTKPIGPFYSHSVAEERARTLGWQVVEDAARGYRRVVPSPDPRELVEEPVIRALLAQDVLVIAAGGGGIPVVRTAGGLKGVEAVIDKDRVSALLATRLGVDCFIISTAAVSSSPTATARRWAPRCSARSAPPTRSTASRSTSATRRRRGRSATCSSSRCATRWTRRAWPSPSSPC